MTNREQELLGHTLLNEKHDEGGTQRKYTINAGVFDKALITLMQTCDVADIWKARWVLSTIVDSFDIAVVETEDRIPDEDIIKEANVDARLFTISVSDVQNSAEQQIGRTLTDSEINSVQKGIEWGLGDTQWDVIDSAIGNLDTADDDENDEDDDDEDDDDDDDEDE